LVFGAQPGHPFFKKPRPDALAAEQPLCFDGAMNADNTAPAPRADATPSLASAYSCVMCGICVPHCPTFGLSENEADGPRGRISLMLGLHENRLTIDEDVRTHLDSCLACRACEAVCPSKVPYGELIDAARATLQERGKDPQNGTTPSLTPRATQRPWRWLRDRVLTQRTRLRQALRLARLAEKLQLGALVTRLAGPTIETLWRTRPRKPLAPRPSYGSHAGNGPNRGRVGLFIGCTGETMNAAASNAALRVLTQLGFEVVLPEVQACCGAMHRHGGEPDPADALVDRNRQVFGKEDVEAIVVVGSGCGAELQEQMPDLPVREVTAFLADLAEDAWPTLTPIDEQVAIHVPCSQSRVLREAGVTQRLLQRIPGLSPATLDSNDRCCGAAGMHVLLYPNQAERLRAPILTEVAQQDITVLASANVGCAAHLAAGLAEQQGTGTVSVMHPVELIDRAMK